MDTLKFIDVFFKTLENNQIRYVHWKSNLNLHNALLGDDDLDILVHPEDKEVLYKIFNQLDIIRGYSDNDHWQEDVLHYYGLDKETNTIVHIHLHYALPVGYDYNKNFVLPIVDAVLNHRERLYDINISSSEYEYILLVIRILVKNALTPFLLSAPKTQLKLILGKKVVTGYSLNEFEDLKGKIDRGILIKVLNRDFKYIGVDFFEECEEIINDNKSLLSFLRIANRLKKKLKPYRTNNELYSFSISFARINKNRLLKIKNKLIPSKVKGTKYPEHGGRIFAFIGGDGAGKSTNIDKLKMNLSKTFATTSIHIGKPPKSTVGGFLYYISKSINLLGFKSFAQNTMYLRLAIDRKKAFKKAVKLRNKGVVVILDRIPIPDKITAMDAPRIDHKKYPRLARFERKQYKEISGVDLLLVMKLDPEIALQRRPEDNPDQLRVRSGQVWTKEWSKPYQIVSNTGVLNFKEVEQRILQKIWDNFNLPYKRIEILGVSGVGKSSVTSLFNEIQPNTFSSIKIQQFPLIGLRTIIRHTHGFVSRFKATNKNRKQRLYFNISYLNNVILEINMGRINLNSNLLLDQSIIFSLVFAYKEGFLTESEFIQNINHVAPFFDFVVLLTAPEDVLFQRVKTRTNQGVGRAKDMSTKEFEVFYDDYNNAFQKLYKTNLKILQIDSSKYTVEEITTIISNHKE